MSESTPDRPEEPPDDQPGESPDARPEAPTDGPGPIRVFAAAEDVREYLLKGALVVLALIAVVGTFQFYTSALAAIDRWVAPDFRPVFRAAFNLAVVLLAGAGISLVVRELSGGADPTDRPDE